MISYFIVTR